jgi:hypothetical protein
VEAAEGCLEAQACPVAEQRALRLMLAIDQSFDGLLELGNARFRRFAPVCQQKRRPKRVRVIARRWGTRESERHLSPSPIPRKI